MRVNLKKFRIEKAASKDETRPILNCVHLDVVHSVLVATDSYGLAVIPVSELALDDTEGLIPAEAIQLARADQGKRADADLSANGTVSVSLRGNLVEFARADGIDLFPDWTKAIATSGRPVAVVAINPRTLVAVADAIGCGGMVKLELFSSGKAKVSPLYWDEDVPMPRGLVMTQKVKEGAAA